MRFIGFPLWLVMQRFGSIGIPRNRPNGVEAVRASDDCEPGEIESDAMSKSDDRQDWSAAFQRATWGCAPAIGRALGLSARTVQQWGRSDSQKRSPGERLEIVMNVALEHRKPHDALAPLHLLADRLGYRLVPEEPRVPESGDSVETLAQQASRAMIEAGEAVNTVLLALEDKIITQDELDAIDRECDEAIEAITRLKQIARLER
jgi:hypothetical protein